MAYLENMLSYSLGHDWHVSHAIWQALPAHIDIFTFTICILAQGQHVAVQPL